MTSIAPAVTIIDALDAVRSFGASVVDGGDNDLLLRWLERWSRLGGRGVSVGLLDSEIAPGVRDLERADVVVRVIPNEVRNRDRPERGATLPGESRFLEHGTHSATLLAGQGQSAIRGLTPNARLLLASVVESSGVASSSACARAIRWLVSAGAHVIAIPLGDGTERDDMSREIDAADRAGVIVFAAAGNCHPSPLAFPARHAAAIAVGAADDGGTLLIESSRAPRLDLIAPGHAIAALVRDGVIGRRRGTSVACVIAAGVAALALSAGAVAGKVGRRSLLATLRRGGSPP
jgi:subtilisin family serine protease